MPSELARPSGYLLGSVFLECYSVSSAFKRPKENRFRKFKECWRGKNFCKCILFYYIEEINLFTKFCYKFQRTFILNLIFKIY